MLNESSNAGAGHTPRRGPEILQSASVGLDDLLAAAEEFRRGAQLSLAAQALDRIAKEFNGDQHPRFGLEMTRLAQAHNDHTSAIKIAEKFEARFPAIGHFYKIHAESLACLNRISEARDLLAAHLHKINDAALQRQILYLIFKIDALQNAPLTNYAFSEPKNGPPRQDAVAVLMVKDEEDIIFPNLVHHYRIGFRKFAILNNNSSDQTRKKIDEFRLKYTDSIIIVIDDYVAGYFQAEKTAALATFAKNYFQGIGLDIDWCFIIDADEFICGPDSASGLGNLLDLCAEEGRKFIVLHLCNATPEYIENYDPELGSVYEHFSRVACFNPNPVLKNAFEYSLNPGITTGNHFLVFDNIDTGQELIAARFGWRLVHLPYRSESQIYLKIMNGSNAIRARGDTQQKPHLGGHWKALREKFDTDGREAAKLQMQAYHKLTLQHTVLLPRMTRSFFFLIRKRIRHPICTPR